MKPSPREKRLLALAKCYRSEAESKQQRIEELENIIKGIERNLSGLRGELRRKFKQAWDDGVIAEKTME